jgi:hypothetical protein
MRLDAAWTVKVLLPETVAAVSDLLHSATMAVSPASA